MPPSQPKEQIISIHRLFIVTLYLWALFVIIAHLLEQFYQRLLIIIFRKLLVTHRLLFIYATYLLLQRGYI